MSQLCRVNQDPDEIRGLLGVIEMKGWRSYTPPGNAAHCIHTHGKLWLLGGQASFCRPPASAPLWSLLLTGPSFPFNPAFSLAVVSRWHSSFRLSSLPSLAQWWYGGHPLKVLTNEKRGGLKVIAFDRSPFKLFTLRFSNQSVQAPSFERRRTAQRSLFLSFEINNCFQISA